MPKAATIPRPVHPISTRPCITPRPLLVRRRRRSQEDEQLKLPILIDPQTPREELIAWAWENHRYDILAQFGIYASPDP